MFLCLVTKMSDQFLEEWINIILCEIRKQCKWHLCNVLQGLWDRSYEKDKCFWLVQTVKRKLTFWNHNSVHSFFDINVLFTLNSSPNAKQSTKLIIWKNWSGYLKLWVEKCLNYDPVIGFSTMTMLQLTRNSQSCSSWPKNPLLKLNTHPIPLIWLQMASGCFQECLP